MDEPASFKTPQDEIAYLRKALEDKQQELDESDRNFADFQQFSKQLEDEMEQELQASEKKFADVDSKHKRLRDEYERLVDKSSKQSKEQTLLISTLQEELNKVTQQRNSMQKDLRRLEQENDSLEQRERMLSTSVADMQERLEKVMEENVWVQSELDEHNAQANESAQRLRDEIRDLKLEISIMENKPKPETITPVRKDSLLQAVEVKRVRSGSNAAPPIAMTMVSDMLNLVKELEVRIASYKSNRSLLTPPSSPRYTAADADGKARVKFTEAAAKVANGLVNNSNNNNNNNATKQSNPNLRQDSSGSESDSEPESSDTTSTDEQAKKSAVATK